ncbi:MAG: hypothetical protein KF760_03835 [Candidatus Eremiobacteraeota bacterium]|nr:hypothetical protein [Candidatus Eremiobacteraeota bacterium]MCW5870097.1 hypothetical protein [Candidatus Eremiobacteraeota bacterium]
MKRMLVALCLSAAAWAEPVEQAVGPHQAYWDDEKSNGLILVSLGGTNSRPTDLEAFNRQAVELGYKVLALAYPNTVISTACRDSKQPDAFDRFRESIVEGKPTSELVEVDRANSIEGRLQSALTQLQWPQDWSKMVVVGHSQGSGHAAYLGKLHRLRGVIMLAGPQDDGARWLSRPGQTDPLNYVGFLHEKDFFEVKRQARAITTLRQGKLSPQSLIISRETVDDPHVSVIQPQFQEVWRQLLGQFRVACLSRKDTEEGGWIEHLQDSQPHLGQRAFLPSQQQKTPVVVECFTTATPPSSSLLLHYCGPPQASATMPPVVIVPGAKVDATFYQALARTLKGQGRHVYTLTFAHNQDDNYVQAQQLANAIARVRQLSEAAEVDLVAHSKGCVVATVYCTPEFRRDWMTAYQGDVRRLLLVGGPNGGIDYFHRHPFEDQGASNWPMVWKRLDGKDCSSFQMDLAGYWPGQAQLVARWDGRYPPRDKVSYYGGTTERFEAEGIDAAVEAGENFMARLHDTPIAPTIQVGLLAGNVADVPGFRNEKDGASDGIILLDSALRAPYRAHLVKKTVLPCNHIQLILGSEAQAQISEFLR